VSNRWREGDRVSLQLPMQLKIREWEKNRNSVSVDYGPLTFSLLIEEKYEQKGSRETAIGDSRWQENADQAKWPSFEIHPASAWNYGLLVDKEHPAGSFTIERRPWPKDDDPFTNASAPIQIKAMGKQIPGWKIDQYGLCGVLPQSPVTAEGKATSLTLVPMGGARLRISAFPVVK